MPESMVVSTKGQVTIPLSLRKKYGIQAGDRLFSELHETGFFVKKPMDIFALEGFLAGKRIPDDEEDLLTPEMGREIFAAKKI